MFLGFPDGSAGKESACNVGDLGWIPGLGRSPGEGKDYPLQYSGLENSMDCIVHEVAKSQTQLSNFHFYFLCTLVAAGSSIEHSPPEALLPASTFLECLALKCFKVPGNF